MFLVVGRGPLNLLFLEKNKMKFNFLKFKKNDAPSLKSLRPKIFDINLYWFLTLGLCSVIFIVTSVIGFNLFYSQYSESYKNKKPAENFENLISVDQLKNAIEKRNEFINKQISLPTDPSL